MSTVPHDGILQLLQAAARLLPTAMAATVDSNSSTRVSSETVQAAQDGPIPIFDANLRVLQNSYISFFTER